MEAISLAIIAIIVIVAQAIDLRFGDTSCEVIHS